MLRVKRFLKLLLVWLLCTTLLHEKTFCINYGLEAKQTQYTDALSISGATNEIRYLARFSGLTFADSATVCVFSSSFSVNGNVNLNGGTLSLDRDLVFEDVLSIVGTGKIY